MTFKKIATGKVCKLAVLIVTLLTASILHATEKSDADAKKILMDDFFRSCMTGNKDEVLAAIKRGDFDTSWRNEDGTTPLGMALFRHNQSPELVQALIDAGFEINNCIANSPLTPLMLVLISNDTPEIAEILLKAGVDPNETIIEGKNVAHFIAAREKKPEVLELVARYGTDIDLKDKEGKTPAWEAFEANTSVEMLKAFKKLGADFNYPNVRGYPMIMCCEEAEKITRLAQAGVDLNVRDASEKTPLMRAVFLGAPLDVIQAFIDGGADLNAQDSSGRTALIYSIVKARPDVESLLRQSAADDTIIDNNGKRAFDYTPEGIALAEKKLEEKRKAEAEKNKP